MNKLQDMNCALTLENMVFEKISFIRKDFKSDEKPCFSFQVISGKKIEEELYKITVVLHVEKAKEYEIEISLSGFFTVNGIDEIADNERMELINKNTVAILMPYIRSELSLLTAQPGMECIVMPPININAMMESSAK